MSEGTFLNNLSKFPLGPLRLLVLGFVFATYALTIGMAKTGSFSLYNQGAIEKAQSYQDSDSEDILPENHDFLRPTRNATINHDELSNRGEASKAELNPRKENLDHSELNSQTQVQIQIQTQEKMETQRMYKASSLRFDWTNLPPQTELGRRIQRVQSQCLQLEDKETSEKKELQRVVAFSPQPSGIGSAIHTWMRGLCYATENNFVLLTRMGRFQWNDQELCPSFMQQQQTQLSTDRLASKKDGTNDNNSSSGSVPTMSAFWCYFGHHESGLQCPGRTLNFTHIEPDKAKWIQYRCPKIMNEFGGLAGMSIGAAEWLFQNVSQLVIQEAERQVHEEAFPNTKRDSNKEKLQASAIPPSESIITVHIRWGDKAKEMTLQPIDAYINATLVLFTPEERKGETPVYIYVSTEDPTAVEEFQIHAQKAFPSQIKWSLCTSGPKNPTTNFKMTNAAQATNGKAGLQSMGALLIALEANRYVLTGRSNWSRLINELRQSVVDSRCGNCTTMLDVTAQPTVLSSNTSRH